jgi:hypothetical protein
VTFVAKNTGPDDVHEMVVLRTDLDPAALPVDNDGKADEEGDGISSIGETGDVAVGATKDVAFDLAPGKYVLICNIVQTEPDGSKEAHYKGGMRTAFTVDRPLNATAQFVVRRGSISIGMDRPVCRKHLVSADAAGVAPGPRLPPRVGVPIRRAPRLAALRTLASPPRFASWSVIVSSRPVSPASCKYSGPDTVLPALHPPGLRSEGPTLAFQENLTTGARIRFSNAPPPG